MSKLTIVKKNIRPVFRRRAY